MLQSNGVALDWVTLFKFKEKDKNEIIKQIKKEDKISYDSKGFACGLGFVRGLIFSDDQDDISEQINVKACEIVALNFCLRDTDFAKDILSAEDYAKALNLFDRKQYSSKLLKELLSTFNTLIHKRRVMDREGTAWFDEFKASLKFDFARTVKALTEEQAEKSFSELKKQIEKIASGVKIACYFAAEADAGYRERALDNDLNKFLIDKYGYNLNKFSSRGEFFYWNNKSCPAIYKKALLDSDKFWAEHEKFNVFAFVDNVYHLNDLKHAQKVLAYIFDNIKKNDIGAKLIAENLPLNYLRCDEFFESCKNDMMRYSVGRFEGVYDLTKIQEYIYCYPLFNADLAEEHIARGKKIFAELICSVYPTDGKKVLEFLVNQANGKEETFWVREGYSVKELLSIYSTGCWLNATQKKVLTVYCPDYFDTDIIWDRIYIIANAAAMLESDRRKCFANLFEIYYDLFKTVEKKFGIKTSYQKDNTGRDNAFTELKKMLCKYGITASEKMKDDYIVSLLDRKVAVIEEIERFPVLEQLGDAIYGLAVAEMMFYQPAEIEDESIFKQFDNYVCAEAQVSVAHKLGIDKLYLSSHSLSYKYTRETFVDPDIESFAIKQETEGYNCKFKFLADSLEMVIGTICKDCGYQTAIDFTKRVVKETYPDIFIKEIRWENRNEVNSEQVIDWEYWNRIQPSPFHEYETYSSKTYNEKMWDALDKFMLAYSLGTENVRERKFITNRYSRAEYGNELYGSDCLGNHRINYAMYDYLHNGLAYVVDKYSAIIKENYKKTEK